MIDHDTFVELVPLLALDALTAPERDRTLWHARSCEVCRLQLAEYEGVSAALASDGPPPRHVWPRIVAMIDAEHTDAISPRTQREAVRQSRPSRVTSIAAVAAVVFAGLAAGLLLRGPVEDLSLLAARAAEAPGSYVGDFIVDEETVASVVLTLDGRGFVMPGEGLESLAATRTYQLWVITPDERVISGGVLGNAPTVAAFTWSGPASGFALTRETAGGVVVSEGDLVAVATERAETSR